jgi:hypothetical protein
MPGHGLYAASGLPSQRPDSNHECHRTGMNAGDNDWTLEINEYLFYVGKLASKLNAQGTEIIFYFLGLDERVHPKPRCNAKIIF